VLLQSEQAYMIDIYESESARYTSHDSPNVVNLARIVQMRILCGYPYPILADLDLDVDTKVVSADEDMSQSTSRKGPKGDLPSVCL